MRWPENLDHYPKYWHTRLRRGFGLGVGDTYRPWIRVRDIPSSGSSGNPTGIRVARIYHLLSELERIYFFLLERQPDVVDIREQFPILHLHGTLELCAQLDVMHARKGRYPEPFTLDFMVTRQTSSGLCQQARSIKTPKDAKDPNVRRRLNIEYQWCRQNDIDWSLVDTSSFTKDLLSTLVFMRGWSRHGYKPDEEGIKAFTAGFHLIYRRNVPLRELLQECASHLRIGFDQCQNAFRYGAWADWIQLDLSHCLAMNLPVVLHGS
jgi:hypothetical protein